MADIHDRRPVVLESERAWQWMYQKTPVEEAAILQEPFVANQGVCLAKGNKAVNRRPRQAQRQQRPTS